MNIEIRTGSVRLSGYVNVAGRQSRPVITPRGKVIEEIEPRAFQNALDKADNITLTKDHGLDVLAETQNGSLELYEDNIGLHYDAEITDGQTIAEARAGKIRGMSFGMQNVVDQIEERADALPLRKITGLDLDHITLVVKKNPVYSATSIEIRADTPIEIETRSICEKPKVTDIETNDLNSPFFDISDLKNRLNNLKK